MVNPYEWEGNYLLVSVTSGSGNLRYLLDHMSQAEFCEYMITHVARTFSCYSVCPLTKEAFEILENNFRTSNTLLEGN